VAGIQAAGGSAMVVAADVSSHAEQQAVVERVLASWGRWDVLVNNAAVASQAANRKSNPSLRKLSDAIILRGAFARTLSCSC
jgi:NAD(P)-dependent dehydrogenase (short-subunit alcohol dehydrogenase family)